jgi:hypothetical protein
MTEALSPAANAVLDAFLNGFVCRQSCNVAFEADRNGLAAVLRAVAERNEYKPNMSDEMEVMFSEGWNSHRKELLAIADELEGQ